MKKNCTMCIEEWWNDFNLSAVMNALGFKYHEKITTYLLISSFSAVKMIHTLSKPHKSTVYQILKTNTHKYQLK